MKQQSDRRAVMKATAVLVGLAVLASACTADNAPQSVERVASPTTASGAPPVEPILIDGVDGPAGRGPAADTTVSETTVPDTIVPDALSDTLPDALVSGTTILGATALDPAMSEANVGGATTPTRPPTLPPTVPATLPRTAPPTLPPTVPPTVPPTLRPSVKPTVATVPPTPAPTPASTPASAPEPTPAETSAPAAPNTRATTAKRTKRSTTTQPTSSVAAGQPVLRTDAKLAVANTRCVKSQVGLQRRTKKGAAVVCTRTKAGVFTWLLSATTTLPPAIVPAMQPGFDGRSITIGVIGTSTNPTWSNISKAITAGFEARIAAVNRRGGIGGRYPVRVVVRDANYDPSLTLAELAATQASVIGYGSILGTPATEAAVPFLRDNQLLASPASQEGRWAKEQNLLPVFNSYQTQAISGVAYFLEQAPGATVCSVSIATSFGDAGAEGFTFAAADLGAKVGASLQMAPNDVNPAPVLAQLARGGCQGVVTTLAPQQLVQLVMGAGRSGLTFRWIALGAGFSDRIITSQTSKTFEATCWVVGDGPVWGQPETAGLAADLLASDNRYWTENPDVGLTFGYTQAKVWEAILERAVASGDMSRAGVLAASRAVGSVDTGGLGSPIDYSQPVRLSAPRASIYAVDGSYKNSIRMLTSAYSPAVASRFRLR